MKDKIQIKFVDFWSGFDETSNYFVHLLGDSVKLSETPEILFFSNFGNEHLKYSCFKIFFSSENERPNFFETDIALTFDYNASPRHFRLPLYLLYIHKYKLSLHDKRFGIKLLGLDEWQKKKFCCMVVSNGNSKMRNSFYKFLAKKESIDSGGKFLNNVGGPVKDKLDFIKDYKFVISFENSSYKGYTTEKILEPFLVNSIPIYWGNKSVDLDFNSKAFLNVGKNKDFESVYAKMKFLENNPVEALKIINADKISLLQEFYEPDKIKFFIINSFYSKSKIVSQFRIYKWISFLNLKLKTIKYWTKHFTVGNYR
jgi:hypothetical protein